MATRAFSNKSCNKGQLTQSNENEPLESVAGLGNLKSNLVKATKRKFCNIESEDDKKQKKISRRPPLKKKNSSRISVYRDESEATEDSSTDVAGKNIPVDGGKEAEIVENLSEKINKVSKQKAQAHSERILAPLQDLHHRKQNNNNSKECKEIPYKDATRSFSSKMTCVLDNETSNTDLGIKSTVSLPSSCEIDETIRDIAPEHSELFTQHTVVDFVSGQGICKSDSRNSVSTVLGTLSEENAIMSAYVKGVNGICAKNAGNDAQTLKPCVSQASVVSTTTAIESVDAYETLEINLETIRQASLSKSEKDLLARECRAQEWDDLDAEDKDDPLMVSEYIPDIMNYLFENEALTQPEADYIDKQAEITWQMREVLINWVIEVHHQMVMFPETLFLAVNLIDRFLSKRFVAANKLQLVGIVALLISSKYEEMSTLSIKELAYAANNSYSESEILSAERFMLGVLNFDLSYSGPMTFLRRVSKADNYDLINRTVAKYFLEISIVDHNFLKFPSSLISACSIYLARKMFKSGDWNANLVHYSGYSEAELQPCADAFMDFLLLPCKNDVLHKKYSHKKFYRASLICRKWAQDHTAQNSD
ncbi:G2/mitotic-specific cyclin cdc13 [Zancudomyces culisetae]|uniref:G2/mitotic-specific cyclin cdc13 n=1 Tax=Zancudomyces culisetae TaxID=1213189 RepID=A0A1R1PGC3_ZANCU|nr:G2/mitotic-specific cyclin cdc13 [Zancudomyces culisetae]|eukprot:OMH80045.1 G2/mitotic-specific cyclin cdc13 [Zancudomyces culisetae]